MQYIHRRLLLRELQVRRLQADQSQGWKLIYETSMVILDCAIVRIGNFTKFGPGVSIFAATHPAAVQERRESPDYSKEVTIGNDCWIGGHTVILPGVTIGDGVTVGASSVVTRNIPSYSIAVGSPARVIRKAEPVTDVLKN
jgi:acetyltransferase-like isoleucine patch superfamily enzyme